LAEYVKLSDKTPPILSLLNKAAFLDLLENFILFDRTEGEVQKIVARNHQYLGVNRVIDKLLSEEPGIQAEVEAGRLGVFWHTQGSGKSYSMIFLTEKIHRKISARYTCKIHGLNYATRRAVGSSSFLR